MRRSLRLTIPARTIATSRAKRPVSKVYQLESDNTRASSADASFVASEIESTLSATRASLRENTLNKVPKAVSKKIGDKDTWMI